MFMTYQIAISIQK